MVEVNRLSEDKTRPKNREANIQGILRYFCIKKPKPKETLYVATIRSNIFSILSHPRKMNKDEEQTSAKFTAVTPLGWNILNVRDIRTEKPVAREAR
jgi:hypothetical protein